MLYRIADIKTTNPNIIGRYLAHWYRSALGRVYRAVEPYLERVGIIRPETLAEHFARSTLKECRDAANVIGVEVIWDRMIDPLI
jgi:hypothetical protein